MLNISDWICEGADGGDSAADDDSENVKYEILIVKLTLTGGSFEKKK